MLFFFICPFKCLGKKKSSGDLTAFKTARNLASNNQRKQAQDNFLHFILTKYPDYHDVRIYLANDGWTEIIKAKKEFEVVL
jgi:hypothetical protein